MSMLAAPADVEKVCLEFICVFGTIIFGLGGVENLVSKREPFGDYDLRYQITKLLTS